MKHGGKFPAPEAAPVPPPDYTPFGLDLHITEWPEVEFVWSFHDQPAQWEVQAERWTEGWESGWGSEYGAFENGANTQVVWNSAGLPGDWIWARIRPCDAENVPLGEWVYSNKLAVPGP